MTAHIGIFLEQAQLYFVTTGKEFSWFFLPLCVVPFCFLHRMAAEVRWWILGLLPVYVCLAFLILAALNPAADRQSQDLYKVYFSASYVVLALWMGCGLIIFGSWLAKPGKPLEATHFPI